MCITVITPKMTTQSFHLKLLTVLLFKEKKKSPSDPGIILASNVGAHSIRWRALVGAQQCRQLAQSKRQYCSHGKDLTHEYPGKQERNTAGIRCPLVFLPSAAILRASNG